jgi:hypothetical protein
MSQFQFHRNFHLLLNSLIFAVVMNPTLSTAATFLNGSFDAVGPNGASVTHNNLLPTFTAAANWTIWQPPSSGTALSQLVPSTNPLVGGGGNALSFVTSTGYAPVSAPGVFQALPFAPTGSMASIDVFAPAGQLFWLGFVDKNPGAFMFENGASRLIGTGVWTHYEFVAGTDAQSFGFELPIAGSQLIVDNAVFVSAVPELPIPALILVGLVTITSYIRARSKPPM